MLLVVHNAMELCVYVVPLFIRMRCFYKIRCRFGSYQETTHIVMIWMFLDSCYYFLFTTVLLLLLSLFWICSHTIWHLWRWRLYSYECTHTLITPWLPQICCFLVTSVVRCCCYTTWFTIWHILWFMLASLSYGSSICGLAVGWVIIQKYTCNILIVAMSMNKIVCIWNY